MREGFKNWILLFTIVIITGVIVYFVFDKKGSDEEEVLGTTKVNYKYAPYITSLPPIAIKIGEEFEYDIVVSDLDTPDDQIDLYLTEKPIWMYLDGDKVTGIPTLSGTYKFVISAFDGSNSTSQINYILVEENE
jgi:hypothetical protein